MLTYKSMCLQIKKALGGNQYNSLAPSQLWNTGAVAILSNGRSNIAAFTDRFIRGRNILEVAGGGRTSFVEYLVRKKGAKAAISTDIVKRKKRARPELFLQVDLNSLGDHAGEIRKKFSGNLPDTIVGTSFFGVPGLSPEETKRWLTECSKVIAFGGAIVVDFLTYRKLSCALYSFFYEKPVTRRKFEGILNELETDGVIRCWEVGAKRNASTMYRFPPLALRPPSFTYRIFPYGKQL